MKYLEIKPPTHLNSLVRFFWTMKTDETSSDSKFRIVADGCPGLIFHDGEGDLTFDQQEDSVLPSFFLYGQTTGHGDLCSSGSLKILGVNLYPHVLKTLFGFDADEVTDKVIDMNRIRPGLQEPLLDTDSTGRRIDLLSAFLARQQEEHSYTDWSVRTSIEKIEKGKGNIPIFKVYRELKLSERQFERRFKQHVGIRPKLFSRIIRFRSALDQIRLYDYEYLSDIAMDTGYSDQSHFIREFKEFGGLRPGEYHSRKQAFLCRHHH